MKPINTSVVQHSTPVPIQVPFLSVFYPHHLEVVVGGWLLLLCLISFYCQPIHAQRCSWSIQNLSLGLRASPAAKFDTKLYNQALDKITARLKNSTQSRIPQLKTQEEKLALIHLLTPEGLKVLNPLDVIQRGGLMHLIRQSFFFRRLNRTDFNRVSLPEISQLIFLMYFIAQTPAASLWEIWKNGFDETAWRIIKQTIEPQIALKMIRQELETRNSLYAVNFWQHPYLWVSDALNRSMLSTQWRWTGIVRQVTLTVLKVFMVIPWNRNLNPFIDIETIPDDVIKQMVDKGADSAEIRQQLFDQFRGWARLEIGLLLLRDSLIASLGLLYTWLSFSESSLQTTVVGGASIVDFESEGRSLPPPPPMQLQIEQLVWQRWQSIKNSADSGLGR